LLTNALRVSGTGVLAHYYGTKVADGFFHSFSGWAILHCRRPPDVCSGMVVDRFEPGRGKPATKNRMVKDLACSKRKRRGQVAENENNSVAEIGNEQLDE